MKLKIASSSNEQRNTIFGGLFPHTLVKYEVLIPMHQLTCWGDLFSWRSCVCLKELSSDAKTGLERKHKRRLFVRSQFQKREKGHYVATPTWLVTLRDWLLSQVQLPSIPVTQPKQHNHHLWYLATWHPYKEKCSNHANGIFQVKCLNSVSQKRATPYLCIGPNKL